MTDNKELLKQFRSTIDGIKNNQILRKKESDKIAVSLPIFTYSFPQVITKKKRTCICMNIMVSR